MFGDGYLETYDPASGKCADAGFISPARPSGMGQMPRCGRWPSAAQWWFRFAPRDMGIDFIN